MEMKIFHTLSCHIEIQVRDKERKISVQMQRKLYLILLSSIFCCMGLSISCYSEQLIQGDVVLNNQSQCVLHTFVVSPSTAQPETGPSIQCIVVPLLWFSFFGWIIKYKSKGVRCEYWHRHIEATGQQSEMWSLCWPNSSHISLFAAQNIFS